MKLITFAIPCYNSADYMDYCIQSILDGASEQPDDIEIVIVNDGSTKDDTAQKADEWQSRHPNIIKAVHQENGGHGQAVNTGMKNATGLYYKVVDSDDWLDPEVAKRILKKLKDLHASNIDLDLFLCGYKYCSGPEDKGKPMGYTDSMPTGRVFSWSELGDINISKYILMHSVIYKTELLRQCKLELPKKTFYVDNIFVYVPLPYVKSIYYLDEVLYGYFIGRDDQSVNEKVMISRVEQQIRVTKIMIDAYDLTSPDIDDKLKSYMKNYLSMMMAICTVFLYLSDREDRFELKKKIWQYLKENNPNTYKIIRKTFFGFGCNLPQPFGRGLSISLYRLSQKIWGFN